MSTRPYPAAYPKRVVVPVHQTVGRILLLASVAMRPERLTNGQFERAISEFAALKQLMH